MFGIWCQVSGGITGHRANWLKGEGEGASPRETIALFPTEGEAAARCAELMATTSLRGGYTPSGRPIAVASYSPRALSIRGCP
jgi:hypothetical protein